MTARFAAPTRLLPPVVLELVVGVAPRPRAACNGVGHDFVTEPAVCVGPEPCPPAGQTRRETEPGGRAPSRMEVIDMSRWAHSIDAVHMLPALLFWAAVAALTLAGLGPASTSAATLTVNTLNDDTIAGDGACTLREAMVAANGDADFQDCIGSGPYGADAITFSVSG